GLWWAAVPRPHWPQDPAAVEAIVRASDPVWGDRRQELVFIGADPMDEAALRRRLDTCLVEADTFEPARWANLPDPFPLLVRQAGWVDAVPARPCRRASDPVSRVRRTSSRG